MHEWCRCLYCKSQVDLFVGCDVCSSSYPFLLWSACCCKPEILSIFWARVHFNADILNSLKLCYGIIRRLLSSMIICNTDLVIIICCHKCNTWLQYKMIWKNCRVIMTFNVRRQRSWYKTFVALLLPSYSTWSCLIMFLYHPVHSIIQLHMHARCSFFFKIRPLTLLFGVLFQLLWKNSLATYISLSWYLIWLITKCESGYGGIEFRKNYTLMHLYHHDADTVNSAFSLSFPRYELCIYMLVIWRHLICWSIYQLAYQISLGTGKGSSINEVSLVILADF